jgi:type IV pilus assembly protein PilA
MVSKIQKRLAGEGGFTLIELLVVIVILGILVAIAVPSYLSFRGNAQQAAAQSNVRSAIPAAEAFYQIGSTYTGMTIAGLQTQAPGVNVTHVVVSTDGNAYCLDSVNGSKDAYYIGGDQNIGGDGKGFGTDTGTNAAVTTGALCATKVSG